MQPAVSAPGSATSARLWATRATSSALITGATSAAGGWPLVAAYVTLACLVSALCVYLATETFRKDIAEMKSVKRKVIAALRVQ